MEMVHGFRAAATLPAVLLIGLGIFLQTPAYAEALKPESNKTPDPRHNESIVTDSSRSWYQANRHKIGNIAWIYEDRGRRVFLLNYYIRFSEDIEGEDLSYLVIGLAGDGGACVKIADAPGVNLGGCAKELLGFLNQESSVDCAGIDKLISKVPSCQKTSTANAVCCLDVAKVGSVGQPETQGEYCRDAGRKKCRDSEHQRRCTLRSPNEDGVLKYSNGTCVYFPGLKLIPPERRIR